MRSEYLMSHDNQNNLLVPTSPTTRCAKYRAQRFKAIMTHLFKVWDVKHQWQVPVTICQNIGSQKKYLRVRETDIWDLALSEICKDNKKHTWIAKYRTGLQLRLLYNLKLNANILSHKILPSKLVNEEHYLIHTYLRLYNLSVIFNSNRKLVVVTLTVSVASQ